MIEQYMLTYCARLRIEIETFVLFRDLEPWMVTMTIVLLLKLGMFQLGSYCNIEKRRL